MSNAYRCVGVAARNRQNQLRPSSPLRPVATRRVPRSTRGRGGSLREENLHENLAGRYRGVRSANGSSRDTPVAAICATLRVTSVKPCTLAVAARSPSIGGRGLGIPIIAQASAMGSSTGRTRSPNPALNCENHRSKDLACSGSRLRFSSIPRRSSASTKTLVPVSITGVRAAHRVTFGSALSRLRSSDMTFVSSRNFTGRPHATCLGVADQKYPRTPRREGPSRRRQKASWARGQ